MNEDFKLSDGVFEWKMRKDLKTHFWIREMIKGDF